MSTCQGYRARPILIGGLILSTNPLSSFREHMPLLLRLSRLPLIESGPRELLIGIGNYVTLKIFGLRDDQTDISESMRTGIENSSLTYYPVFNYNQS